MAKNINLAERISEMVNDDAARSYIREHTLYPAVLLSGKRIGDEDKANIHTKRGFSRGCIFVE